jgi:hypothetical protein
MSGPHSIRDRFTVFYLPVERLELAVCVDIERGAKRLLLRS